MAKFERGTARAGKKWTAREIEELIELYEANVRWGLIAAMIGRSVPTCYQRLQAIRYYYKMPRRLWDSEAVTLASNKNLVLKKRL